MNVPQKKIVPGCTHHIRCECQCQCTHETSVEKIKSQFIENSSYYKFMDIHKSFKCLYVFFNYLFIRRETNKESPYKMQYKSIKKIQ